MRRSLLLLLLGIASTTAKAVQDVPTPVPLVVEADVPMGQKVYGVVWLHVETDGERPSRIEVRSGNATLADASVANVQSWRFSKHQPTRFDVTFRYAEEPSPRCSDDSNSHVMLELPSFVEVRSRGRWDRLMICDSTSKLLSEAPFVVRSVAGIVLCPACEGAIGVSGAEVLLTRSSGAPELAVVTNPQGQFVFPPTQPGTYGITVTTIDNRQASGRLTVDPKSLVNAPLVVELPTPNERVSDPGVLVTSAKTPHYPPEALSRGLSGEVKVVVSTDAAAVVEARALGAPELLGSAAVANVKTWRVRDNPSRTFVVVYRYVISSVGCGRSREVVTANFPAQVEVRACR